MMCTPSFCITPDIYKGSSCKAFDPDFESKINAQKVDLSIWNSPKTMTGGREHITHTGS